MIKKVSFAFSLLALAGLFLLAGGPLGVQGDPYPCPPHQHCHPAPIKKPAPKPPKR